MGKSPQKAVGTKAEIILRRYFKPIIINGNMINPLFVKVDKLKETEEVIPIKSTVRWFIKTKIKKSNTCYSVFYEICQKNS